jgi:hypothetical protein
MLVVQPIQTTLCRFGVALLFFACLQADAAPAPDPRNFANGRLIPAENYCDQPRIVVTKDGTWVCVLTTGKGIEGEPGQHVVAASSTNKGETWSPLVDVEPADKEITSAYALALITPTDRIYAIYCYNGDAIRTLPDGKKIRDDMQGWCCYRYSDDKGRNWSQRCRIPMRVTAADRGNPWGGKLQMWWAISTPTYFDGKVMFGFTKLGKYILHNGEGWFYRSDNVLTETNPEKIEWQLLPDGDHGVRAPEFGSVQEEFDAVHLDKEDFYAVYRTTQGHAGSTYSRDGGHTWSKPDPLRYQPGGRIVKQSRACTKIWKTRNGRYLLWFHNNGTTNYNNGLNSGSRNIAWLSGGQLKDGFLHWSQPEIVAYVEGGLLGCSYPDLIEDDGRYYLCATQKTEARVMDVDPALLEALWQQDSPCDVAKDGVTLELAGEKCAAGLTVPAPRIPPLCGDLQRRKAQLDTAGSLTIDIAVEFKRLAPGQIILDSRDDAGRGYVLRTGERSNVRFEMNDGWQAASWDSDAGLLKRSSLHHIVVIVDGPAKAISFVVDGLLNDGGAERPFGFGRFNPTFKDISGGRELKLAPALHGKLKHLRLYNRALRTTEAIGNFRAFVR